MRTILCGLLLSCSFLLAQDSNPPKGPVTVRGCVSRASGDYILMKQDPAVTYELQSTHKIKLSHYLGQRVEVVGNESPTMSTSSDASRAAASPVTLTISSIKTIDKECPVREVPAH